jgi:hypothetical protein
MFSDRFPQWILIICVGVLACISAPLCATTISVTTPFEGRGSIDWGYGSFLSPYTLPVEGIPHLSVTAVGTYSGPFTTYPSVNAFSANGESFINQQPVQLFFSSPITAFGIWFPGVHWQYPSLPLPAAAYGEIVAFDADRHLLADVHGDRPFDDIFLGVITDRRAISSIYITYDDNWAGPPSPYGVVVDNRLNRRVDVESINNPEPAPLVLLGTALAAITLLRKRTSAG